MYSLFRGIAFLGVLERKTWGHVNSFQIFSSKGFSKTILLNSENSDYTFREPYLISNLSTESYSSIVENSLTNKLRFQEIKGNLSRFAQLGFSLPETLENTEWKTLLSFKTFLVRFLYLESLVYQDKVKDESYFRELDEFHDSESLSIESSLESSLSDDVKSKLEKLKIVHDLLRQSDKNVPGYLTEKNIREILSFEMGSSKQCKLLEFIGITQDKKDWGLVKKKINTYQGILTRNSIISQRKNDEEKGKMIYGLGNNNIMLRVHDRTMDFNLTWKCIREFDSEGVPLVIDLSFLKNLSLKEQKSCYREISHSVSHNRNASTPFAMYLVNYDENCPACLGLKSEYPTLFETLSPVIVTEKNYIELFPKDRLVYLSPDSRNELKAFNGNDIYIVGGIVDMSRNVPLTLSRAKQENIRHASLPMRKVVGIQTALNIDHMMAIMCEIRYSNDWFSAFRWIPIRKYINRIKAGGSNSKTVSQMTKIYEGFKQLSPKGIEREISAKEYKDRFFDFVKDEGVTPKCMTPWKTYVTSEDLNQPHFDYSKYKGPRGLHNSSHRFKEGRKASLPLIQSLYTLSRDE